MTDQHHSTIERRTAEVAKDKDEAAAEVPADSSIGDAELEEMGLDDIDEASLTESGKVAKAAASARPTKKKSESDDVDAKGKGRGKGKGKGKGKDRKARKRAGDDQNRRTGPIRFVREVITELKKVVWPTRPQLVQYFAVVLVFVLVMITVVFFLDYGLGTLLLKLLG
jgi:preprotein translocase subunit SecE